ncbi:DUF2487 family protein [Paenibacillus sp. GCM10012307]|uniref:DUF2487 family protein n=1 Tax=Paenibacillus roseus TaxID=2798579 RepID=A0A934MMN6_9BACL|nr:DUF2487 family protein [Paenibacillus roseus]MBJ6363550.1 DUF2487 family protein [Paenibacillus roseus]
MKFNEIEKSRWDELKPYLDTCLLPVTGLIGTEAPHKATAELEGLRDVMDLVEVPFKGRLVTYPAYHFFEESDALRLDELCRRFRASGFRYVILVTGKPGLKLDGIAADLVIAPAEDGTIPDPTAVKQTVTAIWQQQKNENEPIKAE